MRIYEENYAYEIEQVVDPATLVATGWKYNIYRVRPFRGQERPIAGKLRRRRADAPSSTQFRKSRSRISPPPEVDLAEPNFDEPST